MADQRPTVVHRAADGSIAYAENPRSTRTSTPCGSTGTLPDLVAEVPSRSTTTDDHADSGRQSAHQTVRFWDHVLNEIKRTDPDPDACSQRRSPAHR